MSPVWNQPSASASSVAPGLFQYPLNRCSPCSSTSPSSAMRTTEPGSGWPTYRHDPALTALSPLKGGFARPPAVAWSLDLGGPPVAAERIVVADVTGDGTEEFLALVRVQVRARAAGEDQGFGMECDIRPLNPGLIEAADQLTQLFEQMVQPVRRRGRGRAEGLFQKGDAHTLGAPHLSQCGRRPRLALDHLGKQSQPHRDDLAILGQP